MSIKRAPRPKTNFTIITNAVLRDENLSFRARGVLACILSRPDNWKTTAESLARESKEGRSAILTVLKELEVAGYMNRTKYRNEKGQWVWESFVYDSPQHNHKPESNYPPTDKPTSGEPSTEIQTLIEEPIKNERKEEVTTHTYGVEITQLSNLLADLIEANGIKRPDVTDKWHQEIERLNRLDGYSYEQIEQTIRWVQQDSFWRSNVLSPAKLRKQFGALQLKMKSSGSGLSGWANVINKLANQSKELGQ